MPLVRDMAIRHHRSILAKPYQISIIVIIVANFPKRKSLWHIKQFTPISEWNNWFRHVAQKRDPNTSDQDEGQNTTLEYKVSSNRWPNLFT